MIIVSTQNLKICFTPNRIIEEVIQKAKMIDAYLQN